jgi:hypothetical protein
MKVNNAFRPAHRMAWEAANGPIPGGMILMHTCDNPPCCNPEQLKLGTRAENNKDRAKKGRRKGARARDLELHPQWATVSRRSGLTAVRNDVGGHARNGPGSATGPLPERKRPLRRDAEGP